MFCEGQNAVSRDQKEWTERSVVQQQRVSSESLLFWRTHYFTLSHYSLLNQALSAAWLPSIHSGFLGTRIADLPEMWAEVWEGLCLILQLCQRKVIAKNQRSQYFLKWIKQGNTYWRGSEPLRASFIQNCKAVRWAALATALVLQEILSYCPHFLWDASYLAFMQSR